MQKYIGTKLVEAVPAIRKGGKVYRKGQSIPRSMEPEEQGYKVRYQDGYESWSPKDVFERAYLPLETNANLKTDAPSISRKMVDDFIVSTDVTTMGEKCTVVRAVLRNGFEIVESSACVSAENYDEKLGADICMEKIRDKVWFLLGFLLQTAVHGAGTGSASEESCGPKGPKGMPGPLTGLDFGDAIAAVKNGARIARKGWNGKGQYVELASGIAYVGPDGNIVNAAHEAIGNRALAFVGTSGVQMGWLASQADMLAEDWEIIGG